MAIQIQFTDTAETTTATETTKTAYVDMGGSPMIDTANRRYVFDHHCDGRFALSAACAQVFQALLQGLDVDGLTVYVNHTDADSVLAAWLLQHPERVRQYKALLWGLVEHVSRIDNHGPAAALPGEAFKSVHFALAPERGEADCEEVFMNRLEKAEAMCQDGTLFSDAPARPEFPGRAIAFDGDGEAYPVAGDTPSFNDVYAQQGMGVIFGDRGMVTIGKLPFFPARSFKAGLIDRLNEAETACGGAGGWGGADSIMGSPRPNGTVLDQSTVLKIVSDFIAD